jgi:hypothetical protein
MAIGDRLERLVANGSAPFGVGGVPGRSVRFIPVAPPYWSRSLTLPLSGRGEHREPRGSSLGFVDTWFGHLACASKAIGEE